MFRQREYTDGRNLGSVKRPSGPCMPSGEMRATRLSFPVFACVILAGCGESASPICSTQWVYGLRIEVRDRATGAPAATGALVVAREGSYAETLRVVHELEAVGADERAGRYSLTISKPGYLTWEARGIRVSHDECHVKTVVVQAALDSANGLGMEAGALGQRDHRLSEGMDASGTVDADPRSARDSIDGRGISPGGVLSPEIRSGR